MCFAGLPGTGKSLLVQQLTQLAASAGRRVHLLQWDVARPPFEASAAGRRYPVVDGVTHPVIRKAVGLWARRAVVAWDEATRNPGTSSSARRRSWATGSSSSRAGSPTTPSRG